MHFPDSPGFLTKTNQSMTVVCWPSVNWINHSLHGRYEGSVSLTIKSDPRSPVLLPGPPLSIIPTGPKFCFLPPNVWMTCKCSIIGFMVSESKSVWASLRNILARPSRHANNRLYLLSNNAEATYFHRKMQTHILQPEAIFYFKGELCHITTQQNVGNGRLP